ncbi:MAG: DUF924 family protein [Candidatus Sedimenticola sp. 6PFRAG7]
MTPCDDVLAFWYSESVSGQWFSSTPELDGEIGDRYGQLWEMAVNHELDSWIQSAEGCLALAIVLDQFPLNMFRGEARSFVSEQQAVEVARYAIGQGFDRQLASKRVSFLYMPLMHSESLDDQALSVECFANAGLEPKLRFAQHHRGLIRRFGRFPHRNAILGRESTPEELEYLQSEGAFTG